MGKFVKGLPRPAGAGRKKGGQNKVTKELREVLKDLVNGKACNLEGWLARIAEDDPARATELYLKMAEFVLPKLSRVEHDGKASMDLQLIYAQIVNTSRDLPSVNEKKYLKSINEGGTGEKAQVIDC